MARSKKKSRKPLRKRSRVKRKSKVKRKSRRKYKMYKFFPKDFLDYKLEKTSKRRRKKIKNCDEDYFLNMSSEFGPMGLNSEIEEEMKATQNPEHGFYAEANIPRLRKQMSKDEAFIREYKKICRKFIHSLGNRNDTFNDFIEIEYNKFYQKLNVNLQFIFRRSKRRLGLTIDSTFSEKTFHKTKRFTPHERDLEICNKGVFLSPNMHIYPKGDQTFENIRGLGYMSIFLDEMEKICNVEGLCIQIKDIVNMNLFLNLIQRRGWLAWALRDYFSKNFDKNLKNLENFIKCLKKKGIKEKSKLNYLWEKVQVDTYTAVFIPLSKQK